MEMIYRALNSTVLMVDVFGETVSMVQYWLAGAMDDGNQVVSKCTKKWHSYLSQLSPHRRRKELGEVLVKSKSEAKMNY